MVLKYKIQFGEATGMVSGSFTEADSQRLIGFRQEADHLLQCKMVREELYLGCECRFSSDTGFEINLPSNDIVEQFLHRMRPFILGRESNFVPAITNIINRTIRDEQLELYFKKTKSLFLGKYLQSQIQISIDARTLNSDSTLDIWLNAFEYHRDDEKRKIMHSINESIPLDVCRFFFLELLIDKMKAIGQVASFIHSIEDAPENSS